MPLLSLIVILTGGELQNLEDRIFEITRDAALTSGQVNACTVIG